MKRKPYVLSSFPLLLALLFVLGCQQDLQTAPDNQVIHGSEELSLDMAKEYFQALKEREGDTVHMAIHKKRMQAQPAANRQGFSFIKGLNRKHVLLDEGYYSETKQSSVWEFPVKYDQKFSRTFTRSDKPLDVASKHEIFKASFDRLLISKNKFNGDIVHRLVTFVPDIEYLKRHNNDITHNHITHLDKDFYGYLVYKNWKDDSVLYYLRMEKGTRAAVGPMKRRANTKPDSSRAN